MYLYQRLRQSRKINQRCGHPTGAVHQLTLNVMKLLQDMDDNLYEYCRQQLMQKRKKKAAKEQLRAKEWKVIEGQAEQRRQQLQLPAPA